MHLLRLHFEDALEAVGGAAAGPLDEEGHRIAFIHQAQLALLVGLSCIARIHKDPAARHDAMHVRHHRRNPAHVVVLAARSRLAGQPLVDVALYQRLPVARIRHVDREILRVFRDAHVFLGQPGTIRCRVPA
jgi:hypothetical protein